MGKINHNPYNLQLGEKVILDEDFENSSEVIIVDFTPFKMYSTIRNFGSVETWEVMTSRLSPVSPSCERDRGGK